MTVQKEAPLLIERDGAVLTLVINDPPWNRMSFAYMDALEAAVADAAEDPGVRALVFTARGTENFSVGMDLKQLVNNADERGGLEAILDQRLRVLAAIESLSKPSVVTMFGHCLGGGLELPLACHFRLAATEGLQAGLPELELGTVPAWGGTARLTRCVGRDHTLDMILRGRKVDGEEAYRIGLVHELHPSRRLKQAAQALAQELAAKAPIAVAGVLNSVVGAGELPLEEALATERQAVKRCAASRDQQEGLQAFIQKRKANFVGQ